MASNPYSEHVKLARSHLRRLETARRSMAEEVERLAKLLNELMEDWKRGAEWD